MNRGRLRSPLPSRHGKEVTAEASDAVANKAERKRHPAARPLKAVAALQASPGRCDTLPAEPIGLKRVKLYSTPN
ncbi:MAG: hypothetical protein ABSG53_17220, partial [Thermoguttaceae bacterium]